MHRGKTMREKKGETAAMDEKTLIRILIAFIRKKKSTITL